MTSKPCAALVIGDDCRSFLSVVRSLGRRGIDIHAAPYDFSSPALLSRYITRSHVVPPYSADPEAWLRTLERIIHDAGIRVVYPCDDRALLPLNEHRDAFGDVHLAIPNPRAIEAFYDKHATRTLASQCSVPVAAGRLLSDDDTADGLAGEFRLPLVIKPRRSFLLSNTAQRRAVIVARDVPTIETALGSIRDRAEYLVESFFVGIGGGVSLLASRGAVGPIFQHQRVREPKATGGSSYRVSMAVDPQLAQSVHALAEAVELDGLGMFEFKYDPRSRSAILLEVNARFWGSLPLAVASGVDFPWHYHRLLIDGVLPEPHPYRAGHYGRSISADAYNLIEELADARSQGSRAVVRSAARMAGETLRLLSGRESQDSFQWQDMRPWRREISLLGRQVRRKAERKMGVSPTRLAERRKSRASDALARIPVCEPVSVVFVCFGNICRSPFAARRFQALLDDREQGLAPGANGSAAVVQGQRIRTLSSGLLARHGRPSPPEAVAAARIHGVELADHRSRYLGAADLARHDVIVVFDEANEAGIEALGIDDVPVLRLGDFLTESPGEVIDDPYGHPQAAFAATYATITKALKELTAFLHEALDRSPDLTAPSAFTERYVATAGTCRGDDARRPVLAVVVDTEEDFDWSAPFSRDARTVASAQAQDLAHAIYDPVGLVPTYVIDTCVARDPDASAYFAALQDAGRAEIGAHLHSWVAPPYDEAVNMRNSYQFNLPAELECAKIRQLTEDIAEAVGRRPVVFKAGRYGVGLNTVACLRTLGYEVDCSVAPHSDFSRWQGPNFFGLPSQPFWLDKDRTLLEIPLTKGFAGHAWRLGAPIGPAFDKPWFSRAKVSTVLARTGLLDRIPLSPEGTTAQEMIKLIDAEYARGGRIFTLTYHSPSLVPGNTSYVQSQADLERFLGAIQDVLRYFSHGLNGRFSTVRDIARMYRRDVFDIAVGQPGVPAATGRQGRLADDRLFAHPLRDMP
ncbi:MAG: ATP-grasp domain-containing protein [Pseudomonadota bacterium]